MFRLHQLAICALAVCLLTACKPSGSPVSKRVVQSPDSIEGIVQSDEVAVIKTSYGEMSIEFWPDVAPGTVANFVKLAKEGFYDGCAFHRVVAGFMIQGGDPLTKDESKSAEWGTGDPGYKIEAEFNNRPHVRGVISMARGPAPDSAGCQFFICLDRAASLDGKYTAFGKLIDGDDTLAKIGEVKVVNQPGMPERSRPAKRVHVESVRIVKRGEEDASLPDDGAAEAKAETNSAPEENDKNKSPQPTEKQQ